MIGIVCRHIGDGSAKVRFMCRDEDGDLQLLCEGEHEANDIRVVETDRYLAQAEKLVAGQLKMGKQALWRADGGWSIEDLPDAA